MRQRLLFILGLLLLAVGTCSAQQVGLLLGLRQQSASQQDVDSKATYRTLWIVVENGHAVLRASRPGLLVPRKTGFWQVGVTRQTRKQWTEDQIWAVPAGATPRLHALDPDAVKTTDGSNTSILLFVGPDYLGAETSSQGFAQGAAHPFAGTSVDVFPLDKLRSHAISTSAGYVFGKEGENLYAVPITVPYGSAGRQALHAGAQAYRKTLKPDMQEVFAGDVDDTDWTLVRRHGQWVTRGRLGYSAEVYRGRFADFDVAASPPETLTGPDTLSLPWETIKQQVPEAIDAMTPPGGAVLVVLTRTRLTVYPLHGTTLGPPMLTVPLHAGESAVMIQWALGSNVRRWTQQVTSNP